MKNINKIIREVINNYDDEEDIEKWMGGECIAFVVALKDIFPGYGIAVLNDEYDMDDEDIEYNFNFVHAFCYVPGNHNIIIDAKGIRRLKDLYKDFYDINPVIDWDIPDSDYLISNYAGKEFYSEESYEYDHSEFLEAREWIESNIDRYKI